MVRDALVAEGFDPGTVKMREMKTTGDAERERFVGSPTIRIAGADVAPVAREPVGLSCRVYRLRDGRNSPTPAPQDIRDAIRRTTE